jgi:hypothetical protein
MAKLAEGAQCPECRLPVLVKNCRADFSQNAMLSYIGELEQHLAKPSGDRMNVDQNETIDLESELPMISSGTAVNADASIESEISDPRETQTLMTQLPTQPEDLPTELPDVETIAKGITKSRQPRLKKVQLDDSIDTSTVSSDTLRYRPRRQSAKLASENLTCLYDVTGTWSSSSNKVKQSKSTDIETNKKRRVTFVPGDIVDVDMSQDRWQCPRCTMFNPLTAERCMACNTIARRQSTSGMTLKRNKKSNEPTRTKIRIAMTMLSPAVLTNCQAYIEALKEHPGFMKQYDIDWSNDVDDQVTHLVTAVDDRGFCSRSTKYMLALLKGLWIVKYDCKQCCTELCFT